MQSHFNFKRFGGALPLITVFSWGNMKRLIFPKVIFSTSRFIQLFPANWHSPFFQDVFWMPLKTRLSVFFQPLSESCSGFLPPWSLSDLKHSSVVITCSGVILIFFTSFYFSPGKYMLVACVWIQKKVKNSWKKYFSHSPSSCQLNDLSHPLEIS